MSGLYNLTVTARDHEFAIETYLLVTVTNRLPVLRHAIGMQQARINAPFKFELPIYAYLYDFENDFISFCDPELHLLPPWLKFHAENNTLQGTLPSESTTVLLQVAYQDSVNLNCQNESARSYINITLNVSSDNRAPQAAVASPIQLQINNSQLALLPNVSELFLDPDNDALKFEIQLPNLDSAPPWIMYAPHADCIYFYPRSVCGTFRFQINASDGIDTAKVDVDLKVENAAPTLKHDAATIQASANKMFR